MDLVWVIPEQLEYRINDKGAPLSTWHGSTNKKEINPEDELMRWTNSDTQLIQKVMKNWI